MYGEAVENYMNDAPIDVGIRINPDNRVTPVFSIRSSFSFEAGASAAPERLR